MAPTLKNGYKILLLKHITTINQGDIVVFREAYTNNYFIKRVVTLNNANIYVEGDNSVESLDSRHFGSITKNQILGKVLVVLWPPKKLAKPH